MTARAVGVDIGGTKVAVAAVDAFGTVYARATFPTEPRQGFARGVGRTTDAIHDVLAAAGWRAGDLAGIGVGCTGPVDPARGTVHNPHTLPTWDDGDLVTPLRQRFGVPVRLENDADAAAVGEVVFGAGHGADPVVVLTFGTGVGFAVVAGGGVYRGAGGAHPELGHAQVLAGGPACYCGADGCLESVASGAAVDRAGRALGLPDARAVFAAASGGREDAAAVVARAVAGVAAAARLVLHAFVPERLVLGGGLMDEWFELFAPAVREQFSRAVAVPGGGTRVVRAALGPDAGVVGAAALALAAAGPPP